MCCLRPFTHAPGHVQSGDTSWSLLWLHRSTFQKLEPSKEHRAGNDGGACCAGASAAESAAAYLVLQVVCDTVEGSRLKLVACFGSSRAAELCPKGVQGPYALRRSFCQLTAGAVMQAPQREGIRLPAMPGLEALSTCRQRSSCLLMAQGCGFCKIAMTHFS